MSKKKVIPCAILAVATLLVVPKCIKIVPQGNVGAIYNRLGGGIEDRVLEEGFNLKKPWEKINNFPVSIETVYMSKDNREGSENDESITISCQDGSLNADLTYSYRFDKLKVPEIQKKYRGKSGEEIMNQVLRGQLRSWVSEVTKNYTTMEVHLTDKETVNSKLTEHLNKKAEKYGITFENVSLAETRASNEVQKAIEKRQQISQELEQQKLSLKKAEVEKEKGQLEANKKVIEAEGEKKANEIKAKGLDDKILKEKMIDKWSGEVPQVIGSDDVMLDIGK